jgi:tripartite-type tricarboxylate transporter receptor subunit TctC
MLTPVCQTFVNTIAMVVRNDSPIKSIADLAEAARAKPDKMNYGHQGVTTIPRLAVEALLDVAKNQAQRRRVSRRACNFDRSARRPDRGGCGRARRCGTEQGYTRYRHPGDQRHHAFPDVPTAIEQGFNVSSASFGGVYARSATPKPIIEKWLRLYSFSDSPIQS